MILPSADIEWLVEMVVLPRRGLEYCRLGINVKPDDVLGWIVSCNGRRCLDGRGAEVNSEITDHETD